MTARITVVGEALLDVDVDGSATRLVPDAPAPVVDVLSERVRPGGAALAALLLARHSCDVTLLTPLGDDEHAHALRAGLPADIDVLPLPAEGETAVKRRIQASGQCLVRVDSGGQAGRIGNADLDKVHAALESDLVLVSDYGRGLTCDPLLRTALEATAQSVPMVWDPHPRGGAPVAMTQLVTPNEPESAYWYRTVSGSDADGVLLRRVAVCADALVGAWQVGAVVVTLGSRGAVLSLGDGTPRAYAAPKVTAADTCGAGDAFAVAAAAAVAEGALISEAVQAAVRSAAEFVAAGGAGSIKPREAIDDLDDDFPFGRTDTPGSDVQAVRETGGTIVATGGCFDLLHAGHVQHLNTARALGDYLIVCVNSDQSVRRLKGSGRPLVSLEDRVQVLESLSCVDAVAVFDETTPVRLLQQIRPHIWVKGGDYAGGELPEASIVESWGGQVLVLPYMPGRSTTDLVLQAARSVARVPNDPSVDKPFLERPLPTSYS
jgi:D-beta-D-heptose 7-phosphate kinase / D-beta-D-heptose 1-phosphate adenosyltransferase